MTRWAKNTELNPGAPEDLAIQWAVVRMGDLELSSFFFFLSQGKNLDLLEQLTLRKAGWEIEKNRFHVTWIELLDQVSAEGSHTWISSYMSLFFFNPILRFSGTCKWKAPKVLSDILGK